MVTPKSICIISRWAFFDQWKMYLAELYHIALQQAHSIPIERYIRNLVHEVPLPPRGCTRVQMQIGDLELLFERPPLNELPTIVSSSAMDLLFGLFSSTAIGHIFSCILQEKSIVMHCKECSFLTQVAHALTSLIFPLRWQHIYVPFLPTAIELSDFISAPSPFIVGVQSDRFEQTYIEDNEELVVVDFNLGEVWTPGYGLGSASRPPKAAPSSKTANVMAMARCLEPPAEESKRLVTKLAKYARGFHSPEGCFEKLRQQRRQLGQTQSKALGAAHRVDTKDLPEGKIKKAFFRFLTSLLRDYRDYTVMSTMSAEQLVQLQEDPNGQITPAGHFETESFVERVPVAARPFMLRLVKGQAFQVFIDERLFQSTGKEFEILFFDHSVAAQKQRDGTQAAFCMDGVSDFLSDQRYRSIKTFVAPTAYADTPRAGAHKTFDDSDPEAAPQVLDRLQSALARTVFPALKHTAFGKPVPKPVLDEESEIRRLSVTTNELIAQQAAAHAEAASAAHEEKSHFMNRVFEAITTPARSTHGRTLNRQSSSPLEEDGAAGGVTGSIGRGRAGAGCATGDGGSCKKQKITTPSVGSTKRRRSSIGLLKRPPASGSKQKHGGSSSIRHVGGALGTKYSTYPPSASRGSASRRRSGVKLAASIGSKSRRLSGMHSHRQSALSPAVSITHSPEVLSLTIGNGGKHQGTPTVPTSSSRDGGNSTSHLHSTPGAAALAAQAAQGFRADYEAKVKALQAGAAQAAGTSTAAAQVRAVVASAPLGGAGATSTHTMQVSVRAAFGELVDVYASLGMLEEAVQYFDEIRELHLPSPHSQWQVVSDLVRALTRNVSALRALRLLETWRKMTPEEGQAMQKVHSATCAAKQARRLEESYGIQVAVEAACTKAACTRFCAPTGGEGGCTTSADGRRSSMGHDRILDWSDPNDPNDYTVRCDGCSARIVPQLHVSYIKPEKDDAQEGGTNTSTHLPFHGQHYSPAVVKKELENLLKNNKGDAGEQQVQIANLLAEKPTLYWNLCVMFLELDCELDFLMLERFDLKRQNQQPKKARASTSKNADSCKRARVSLPGDELEDEQWEATRLSEGDEGEEDEADEQATRGDRLCKQLQYDSPTSHRLQSVPAEDENSVPSDGAAHPDEAGTGREPSKVNKTIEFDSTGCDDESVDAQTDQAVLVLTSPQSLSVEALNTEIGVLRAKVVADSEEKRALRWRLHQKMSRVQVVCRIRPLFEHKNEVSAVRVDTDAATICIAAANQTSTTAGSSSQQFRQFEFDHVFPSDASQAQVFEEVQPAVFAVTQGYRACIFAYGQTGSGKTYTMEGAGGRSARHMDERGVTQRAVETIFEQIGRETREAEKLTNVESAADLVQPPLPEFSVSISLLEIYNEELRDLLAFFGTGAEAPKGNHQQQHGLTITGAGSGDITVSGLTEVSVASVDEVLDVLRHGQSLRVVRSNNVNSVSSRSHLVFTLKLCCVRHKLETRQDGSSVVDSHTARGKLVLVDLAGSERASRTGAAARSTQMTEAKAINKSLSALGDVVAALSKGAQHVPYRNSKLTTLLQDCLGGTCKTIMLVQASPALQDTEESGCSLVFAERVKRVKAAAKRRVSIASGAVREAATAALAVEKQAVAAEEEIASLRARVAMLEAQNGKKAEEMSQTRAAQAAAVKAMAQEGGRLEREAVAAKTALEVVKLELASAKETIKRHGSRGGRQPLARQQSIPKMQQHQQPPPPPTSPPAPNHVGYERERQARKQLELEVNRLKQQLRRERQRKQTPNKTPCKGQTPLKGRLPVGTQRATPNRGSIGHARGNSRDSVGSSTSNRGSIGHARGNSRDSVDSTASAKKQMASYDISDDETSPRAPGHSQLHRLAARNRLSSGSMNSLSSFGDWQEEEQGRASLTSLAFVGGRASPDNKSTGEDTVVDTTSSTAGGVENQSSGGACVESVRASGGRRKSRRENSLSSLSHNTISLGSSSESGTPGGSPRHTHTIPKDKEGIDGKPTVYASPIRVRTNGTDENSPFAGTGTSNQSSAKRAQRGGSAIKQPRKQYNVSSSGYGQPERTRTPGSARRKRAGQCQSTGAASAGPAAGPASVRVDQQLKKQTRPGFLSRFF
jgi:hypothetical protein